MGAPAKPTTREIPLRCTTWIELVRDAQKKASERFGRALQATFPSFEESHQTPHTIREECGEGGA